MPDDLFFKHGWKRYLFRATMAGTLPEAVRWNRSKVEPVLTRRIRQVRESARATLNDLLAAHADNPFVDVDRLRAAREMLAAEVGTVRTWEDERARRRRLRPFRVAAGGRWLAFVDPTVTY